MKKLILFLAIFFLVAFTAGWYLLKHVAPYMIISPPRQHLTLDPQEYGIIGSKTTVLATDSILLSGYYVSPKGPLKGNMILIHGIGGCKEHMLPLAGQLSEMGFGSMVCLLYTSDAADD